MVPHLPGMNPYLENPNLWSEVRSWLIVQMARSLNPQITPKYRAAVENRVYSEAILVGIPDSAVFRGVQSTRTPNHSTSNSTLTQPVKVRLPMLAETSEYQEAALDLAIDYTQKPIPPLSAEAAQWVQNILQSPNQKKGV